MLYAISYLYCVTDFLEIVEKMSPEGVLYSAYLVNLESQTWGDCYEFAFMGAFGMGYKIVVRGRQTVSDPSALKGRDLWEWGEEPKSHLVKLWRAMAAGRRCGRSHRDVIVRPGVLVDLTRSCRAAWIPLDSFLKCQVPDVVSLYVKGV
jgi:hypothetical protein